MTAEAPGEIGALTTVADTDEDLIGH